MSAVLERVDRAALVYPLLRSDEVADMLGITKRSVEEFARQGRLPCIRLGKSVRYCRAQVAAAVEAAAAEGRTV